MLHQSKAVILAASLWATSAWAQSAAQPLNLHLPPDVAAPQTAIATAVPARGTRDVPAIAGQAATQTAAQPLSPANASAPDAQYNEAANRMVDAADSANRPLDGQDATKPACNDAAYAQPQVHGSVGMGVVAGSRINGNYQSSGVQVTKALGSCDHPTGEVSLSIDVGRANFGRSRGWH